MAETATTARRWNSFVCPGCRFVFRVPQDHDGKGVVCPGCKVMLRLPGAEDDPGPLVIERAEPEEHEEEEHDHDDDHDHEDHEDSHDEGSGTGKLIAMMAVPGVLLLGLFAWMLRPEPHASATGPQAGAPAAPLAQGSPAGAQQRDVAVKTSATDQVQLEAAAKNFLEAPTMEEALRWVVQPEKVRAKAEAWYAKHPYQTPHFKGSTSESSTLGQDGVRVVGLVVRIGSFEKRQLAMVKMPDGEFRVDWESWVGWSEMEWADFKKQRPTEAKLFRVTSAPTDYYNFDFNDDTKWVSFRLDSPDRSDFLYGYAPFGSELAALLKPLDNVKDRPVILKLKFPADAKTGDQVIVDGVVGDGWLDLHANP